MIRRLVKEVIFVIIFDLDRGYKDIERYYVIFVVYYIFCFSFKMYVVCGILSDIIR